MREGVEEEKKEKEEEKLLEKNEHEQGGLKNSGKGNKERVWEGVISV